MPERIKKAKRAASKQRDLDSMVQRVNNLTDMIRELNGERADLLVAIWEKHHTRMTADKARRTNSGA